MNFLKKILNLNTTLNTTIETTLTVTSNNGFHLRPIAQFVNEAKKFNATITLLTNNKEVSATQVPKILSLSLDKGKSFTLKCKGKEAKEASEKLSDFFQNLMANDAEVQEIVQIDEVYEAATIKAQTIAKGIVIAPLAPYKVIEHVEDNSTISLRDAIQKTKDELYAHYEQNKEAATSQIFLAQKELLSSTLFQTNFSNVEAFQDVIKEEIEKLQNNKFTSRIADYEDLEQKVLGYLGIHKVLELPSFPYLLLTKKLLPSDIDKLKKTPIKGVILQGGTITSHAAILLRSEAIPSIIIHEEIELSNRAILDANAGDLILAPTQEDLKKATQKQQAFIEALDNSFNKRFELTQTSSGKNIKVLANITDVNSAKEAKEQGADGIGLLRTEFLFTKTKPTVEEQTQAYGEIFSCFNEVTVRTLDIGGDKSLPYVDIEKEENPFLGIRGIRFSLQEQTLFKEQLLAIFKAVGSISSNTKSIKIMFPMVSEPDEFKRAKQIALNLAKEHKLNIDTVQFGIMLEVPSVIFALQEFDKLVDFYSIGTNDLTQYLFAIERTHPTLEADPTSPLLMNALKQIVTTTTKPVSICGELAGLEETTKELITMGYETLSVSSNLIPNLKERIRHV